MSKTKAIVEAEQKDFYIELDRRDQQQIVMHALGESVDELFYEDHGRKALSWEGINTVAFFMGDIQVDDWVEWERVEMFGDRLYWSATVRARNTKYNLSSLGTAEAPERMDVYDRDERNQKIPDPERPGEFKEHLEPDEFCRRKALSKAQRNAKRAVMPTAVLTKWLQYFIELNLFKKGTKLEKPVMPFKPKTVDAEFRVLDLEKPKLPPLRESPEAPPSEVEEPQAEEVPAEGSEPAGGPPGSVEEIVERLSRHIVGLDEWIVVSEYTAYFRIGKRKRLEEEMDYTVDELVRRMGGEWDKDANCWKILKEAEG